MSLDARQVLTLVVRPTLAALGPSCSGEAAEHLLLGTAALESDFRAIAQYGGGPALGLWQMEPATFRDCWANYLHFRPELAQRVRSLVSAANSGDTPDAGELVWNLRLACAMARIKYLRAPAPLPRPRDVAAAELYHKLYYNSLLGKTKPGDYSRAWQRHVAPIL